MPRSENDINTEPCKVCGKVIRYRADIPRHNRLHTTNKKDLMHSCPFEGCGYQNLQKSNVNTHFRTHTGEKPKSCPNCDYVTSDPGSLTRHRKRIHGYEPKKRSLPGKSSTSKRSRRHSPYSTESDPSASPSLSPEIALKPLDIATLYQDCFPALPADSCNTFGHSLTYPWEKNVLEPSGTSSEPFICALSPQYNLRHLSPAVDAGFSLEDFSTSLHIPANSQTEPNYLPSLSFEDLLAELSTQPAPSDPVYPTQDTSFWTVEDQNNLPAWAPDAPQDVPGFFFQEQSTASVDSPDWGFAYPALTMAESPYAPSLSPSSSYSSDFSIHNSPISGLLPLDDSLDSIFLSPQATTSQESFIF